MKKVSEVIAELEALRVQYGDVGVVVYDNDHIRDDDDFDIEYNTDVDEPVILISAF